MLRGVILEDLIQRIRELLTSNIINLGYELYDIEYRDLRKYYPEFLNYSCNYDNCMHVLENIDVCVIKQNVEKENIDRGRYERYVYICQKLKEKYDKRYK